MNIRIGDIVRFISDKLEGKVTGIIDNNTVNVYCDEYGFEIPASVNNLVVIHSDSNTTKTDSATPASGQKNVTMESADTLYIASYYLFFKIINKRIICDTIVLSFPEIYQTNTLSKILIVQYL